MSISVSLDREVRYLAIALGLVTEDGQCQLDLGFFADPWSRVRNILSNETQLGALVDAIGSLLTSSQPSVLEPDCNSKCHAYPLLSQDAAGQIYFLLDQRENDAVSSVTLSVAAEAKSLDGPAISARVDLLVVTRGDVEAVIGSQSHPIRIEGRVPVGADDATLVLALSLVALPSPSAELTVRIEGLPGVEEPLVFDVTRDAQSVSRIAAALLQLALTQAASGSSQAAKLANWLPILLGLSGNVPRLPLEELTRGTRAFQIWLAAVAGRDAQGLRPKLCTWANAIGQLLGAPPLPVPGPAATQDDPIILTLMSARGGPLLWIEMSVSTDPCTKTEMLEASLCVSVISADVDAQVVAQANVLAIPLSGTSPVRMLDEIEVAIKAPAGGGALLRLGAGSIGLKGLKAGLRLTGIASTPALAPILELDGVDVIIDGQSSYFEHLDLASAGTFTAASKNLFQAAIESGIGDGSDVAKCVLKILGLGTDPGLDLAVFVSGPTQALASYYRELTSKGGLPDVLAAVGKLLGSTAAANVLGTQGTADDPWRIALDGLATPRGSAVSLYLALWNESDAESPKLRFALRGEASGNPLWTASATAEVLGFDLPAAGEGKASFLGGMSAELKFMPSQLGELAGCSVVAQTARLSGRWSPGERLQVEVAIDGVTVDAGDSSLDLGNVAFDTETKKAKFTVDDSTLWEAVRILASRCASSWVGPAARTVLGFLGIAAPDTPGIPDDLPALKLPADGDLSSLLGAPLEGLRGWLGSIVSDDCAVSDDGVPFLVSLLVALQAALTTEIDLPGQPLAPAVIPVYGLGTTDNPWAAPLHAVGSEPVELVLWADPAGPPVWWTSQSSDAICTDILAQARQASTCDLRIADSLVYRDSSFAMTCLQELANALGDGDGVLPVGAATPDPAAGWTVGDTICAAHHRLPTDPNAVQQIHAKINSLTEDKQQGEWAVLLLAPPIAGADCWQTLLDGVDPSACAPINLRVSGIDPSKVDLSTLKAATFYVVDLADDGTKTLAKVESYLEHVTGAVHRVKPNAKLVLVAHSYLGPVAQLFASKTPTSVLGLITLGSPLGSDAPTQLDASGLADGVRLLRCLAPSGLAGGTVALGDAVQLYGSLLDAGTANGEAVSAASLRAALTRSGAVGLDLRGVDKLAIVGDIDDDLLAALASTLQFSAVCATQRPKPTHLGWGARTGLGLPKAQEGDPNVEATLRLLLGQVALHAEAAPPPAACAEIRVRIGRENDWLLGGPSDNVSPLAQVRWAELIGRIAIADSGLSVELDFRLHDAALKGSSAAVIDLADPRFAELINALVKNLDGIAAVGGRLDAILGVLAALGLLRRKDESSDACILADELAAARLDGANSLIPLLAQSLKSNSLLGFIPATASLPASGPWRIAFDPLPIELLLDQDPWRVTVHTTGDGLPVDKVGFLKTTATLDLATGKAVVTGTARVGNFSVGRAAAGNPIVLSSPSTGELALLPGDPSTIAANLRAILERMLPEALLTALLEQALGGDVNIVGIDGLFTDPAGWFGRAGGLGDGVLPLAARLRMLLAGLASACGLQTGPNAPLTLPGGMIVDAADLGEGNGRKLHLQVRSDSPLPLPICDGATVALDLGFEVDRLRQLSPVGGLQVHMSLPGADTWGALTLSVGADPSGLRLVITTDSGVDLKLLPTVDGLSTLIKAAARTLLPQVLDLLSGSFAAQEPPPPVLKDVLSVAKELGIYDDAAEPGKGFEVKADALANLIGVIARGDLPLTLPAAMASLFDRLLGAGSVTTAGNQISVAFGTTTSTPLALQLDLTASPPNVALKAEALKLGAATADLTAGVAGRTPIANVSLAASLDTGIGVILEPSLVASFDASQLTVAFQPTGTEGPRISLAPIAVAPTATQLAEIAKTWLYPIAGTLLLREAGAVLKTPLWNGAQKTIVDMLLSTKVARGTPNALCFAAELPDVATVLQGFLDTLVGVEVPLSGGLSLRAVSDAHRYGLVLSGERAFAVGDYSLALRLGIPKPVDPGWGEMGKGVGLLLLDLSDPANPQFRPVLRLGGLGARLSRNVGGTPLVSVGGFRLGAASAYLCNDIALFGDGAPAVASMVSGAVELEQLGMVIGAGDDTDNPVAASILQPGTSGDSSPANPPFDLLVGTAGNGWVIRFGGQPKLQLPVRRTFGPLYLGEIDLRYEPGASDSGKVGIDIDAAVSLAGFTLATQGLGVLIPLDHPAEIGAWQLELAGLAVKYDNPSVQVAGGLFKSDVGGEVEYCGMLTVQLAGRGISGVGAYSRPRASSGSNDRYTSLFAFLVLNAPLGGPPYFFVTGLAGGAGYNRKLLTPQDPSAVNGFPLVAAMDGTVKDPMEQLELLSQDIPPSRGSFWLAAGIRFDTFALLHTTALATLSVDHGLEVTLLGLMRFAFPAAGDAAVSAELALLAKYNSIDNTLSVRGALTENSWVLSRDCQLTGGFAFVAWFDKPEVLLSIGGYSRLPGLVIPDHYPDVPRVGFHWEVGGGVVVKGESFFTLTHAALMFGGSLDATFDSGPISAWFLSDLDVIAWWDPFHYEAEANVQIGARLSVSVCFIGCVTFSVRASVGAKLWLEGPPLHALVDVDFGVASATIEFGHCANQPYLTWTEFSVKYLGGGDATQLEAATNLTIASGVAPPNASTQPSAGSSQRPQSPNGSENRAWLVGSEFSMRVETKMPATSWRFGTADAPIQQPNTWRDLILDAVPCDPQAVPPLTATVAIVAEQSGVHGWQPLATNALTSIQITELEGKFPAAIWDSTAKDNPTREMLAGLGGLIMAAHVTPCEQTGDLGDIPFSTMIEEEPPLPLVFGVQEKQAAVRARTIRSDAEKVTAKPTPKRAPDTPSLRRVLLPRHAASRTVIANVPKELGTALLPRGGAQVWEVDASQVHRVTTRDTASKLSATALSGTGAVLAHGPVVAGGVHAPRGTRTLVVRENQSDVALGWELNTPLLQVGPGTLLSPGGAIFLPHPWAPPRRVKGAGEIRWVSAVSVIRSLDGLITHLTLDPAGEPVSLLVRLDRRLPRARIDAVRIVAEGMNLGSIREVRSKGHPDRVELVADILKIAAGTRAASVRVTCGSGWWLAGVLVSPRTVAQPPAASRRGAPQRVAESRARVSKGISITVTPYTARTLR